MSDISSQIETIRDRLNEADGNSSTVEQIGNILIVLSQIADLLEQTNERIDALRNYTDIQLAR